MSRFTKHPLILFSLAVFLLFSGCGQAGGTGKNPSADTDGTAETSSPPREVSPAFRGFGADEVVPKESGVTFTDGPVTFADPVTEEMLRTMLGKPEGEVLHSDFGQIYKICWTLDDYWCNLQFKNEAGGSDTMFKCTGQPATLEDFALCYNLQDMSIGSIELPSLEPLASLTQLERLYFAGTVVTAERLDELALLPALTRLEMAPDDYMDWSEVTDGSFLLPLADRLTLLEAMGNVRWNPEVLSQMTSLDKLLIENAHDLSFLEDLTQLESLVLYTCDATDWSPLAAQKDLTYLVISGNDHRVTEVSLDDLRPLTSLDYLALSFTTINEECSRQEVIDALPSLTGYHTL